MPGNRPSQMSTEELDHAILKKPLPNKVEKTVEKAKGFVSKITSNPTVQRATQAVKERSREIANESREPRKRGRRERLPANMGITDPGMGRGMFGGNGSGFMQMDPFGVGKLPSPRSAAPRQPRGRVLYDADGREVIIKPRKRRKKVKVSGDDGRFDPMGIPQDMRWMFGAK